MEAIVAEPAAEGQVPKTPVEAVSQVLSFGTFLRNVGLAPAAPKRSSAAAHVQELDVQVEAEKQGFAALRGKLDAQHDQLESLNKKVEESEEAREKQAKEIEYLEKQAKEKHAEENKKQADETNALLRRLFSFNKE